MNTKTSKLYSWIVGILLLTGHTATASDLDLSNVPLATKTEGVKPNIVLIMDDSGSMACRVNGKCADDVFYAPGYDSRKEYRCESGVDELKPAAGEVVVTYISKASGATGTPFFSYDGNLFGWGPKGDDATGLDSLYSFKGNVCFDPDADYNVRLQAKDCSGSDYCLAKGRDTNYVEADDILWSPVEVMSGNFLNWYYSATIAEWSDNTLSGGFKDDYPDHGYWHEKVADNFITTITHFCHLQQTTSKLPYCKDNGDGDDTDGGVYPEKTVINGSNLNGNNKTWFPPMPHYNDNSPGYLGRDWSDVSFYSASYGEHGVYASSASHDHNETTIKDSMLGMKPGVHYNQIRVQVSDDIAKKVVRDLDFADVAVADFFGEIYQDSGVYKLNRGSSAPKKLVHGFVTLDKKNDPSTTDDNKESLIKALHRLGGEGGTPTGRTLLASAHYIFTGWDNTEFTFRKNAAGDTETRKVSELMDEDFTQSQNPPGYVANAKHVTDDNWCKRNAVAILTDGDPSNDDAPSLLDDYVPTGLTSDDINNMASNIKPLARIAGALYDHDFLPDVQGKQNIESFFIAFGADSIIENTDFRAVGRAGGGGIENFYAAKNGSEVTKAFEDIVSRVMADSASVTAIAVSAVSELKTDNYAIQATYDTEYWVSSLKALRLNQDGEFVNPDGTGASNSSSGISPVWEARDVLNKLYVLTDDDIEGKDVSTNHLSGGVKKRRFYTWAGSQGIRFGSDSMSRPSSSSANFSEFDALPEAIRNDLSVMAGTDSQERYDLMMYLLGDITNEVGYPSASASSKYRRRGSFLDADGDGKIDDVHSGGLLGDIVHSSPVYVKEPPRPWDDSHYGTASQPYSEFRTKQQDRPAMVYAGGNDGLLHAFTVEAGTRNSISYPAGSEIFAYMPSMLASTDSKAGFHYLASKSYEHRYYVDLTPTVSDIFMDFYSTGNSSDPIDPEWRTVLVGGLRGGGKGLYALDITCPFQTSTGGDSTCDDEYFGADNVLWEFSDSDDGDLGMTFGEPIVAKVNYDAGYSESEERNGNGYGRWAVIVSNGYNSANGRAVLYILFLDGGIDGTWTLGKDYLKLYADNGGNDTTADKNGLSSATAIDSTGDGLIDRVYAGDLKGNMWVFDLGQSLAYSGK